jgi:capsular exopolysaccharide synthesis family protein
VPKLRFNRKNELGVSALSQVAESFRAMRLTVRHQFPAGEPMVLCVSSPGATEGKSLVSSNLAVAFANAGHSTLLIDGDVRRGVVHTTFDAPRRPGLVDHLAGKASADTIIRPTNTPNLSIIPSGIRSKDAPELLVSDAMASLVSAMRERFEVVIIDSAPFSAGMDAFALGAAAGTMLVVLRPGVTDRKLAAMKLEVLDRLPVAVVGAVLNGIAQGSAYKYYYADYGYSDSRQWALDDDADDSHAALVGTSRGQRLMAPKK